MKLSEIRVGWQVVTRNGETSVALCDGVDSTALPFIKGATLADYNEDLTSKKYPDLDITEVYGWPRNLPRGGRLTLYFKKFRSLLWKDESGFSAAKLGEKVCRGEVSAIANEIDGRLVLKIKKNGESASYDVCESGSRNELITNGERIDYEVFKSLTINGDMTVTLTTVKGNAVYMKSEDSVTAEENRIVYNF